MAKSPQQTESTKEPSLPPTQASPEKHVITTEAATTVWYSLKNRGGVAVWGSKNPEKPGVTWTTQFSKLMVPPYRPGRLPDADITPQRVLTDPADLIVKVEAEVYRFAITRLNDGSVTPEDQHKFWKTIVQAGEGSYGHYKPNAAVI